MTYLLTTASYPALYVSVRALQMARVATSQIEDQRSYGCENTRAATPWLVMFRWIMTRLLGRGVNDNTQAGVSTQDHADAPNRGQRRQRDHFESKAVPASRRYIPRILLRPGLTRAQWMAKDAVLTGYGIIKALRIPYRMPRIMRERLMARMGFRISGFQGTVETSAPARIGGLTRIQLPPD